MKLRLLAPLVLAIAFAAFTATGAWATVYLEENFDSYPAFDPAGPYGPMQLSSYWEQNPAAPGIMWIGNSPLLGDGNTDHIAWGTGSSNLSMHRKMFTPGATEGLYVLNVTAWSNSGNPYGSGIGLGYDLGTGAWESRGNWYYYANKTAVDYVTGLSQTGTFWELDMRYLLYGASYMIYVPEADNAPVNLTLAVDQVTNQARGEIRTATRDIVLPWHATSYSDLVNYVSIWAPGGGYGSIDVDDISVTDILSATITGSITLEDFSGDLSSSPVKIQLVPTSQGELKTATVTLTTNPGTYSVSAVAGTYDISYSACKRKTLVKTGMVLGAGARLTEDASLVNGDVDGDNVITSTDLSVVLKNLE